MKLVATRGSPGHSSAGAQSYQQAPPLGQRSAGKLETKRNSAAQRPGLLDLTDQWRTTWPRQSEKFLSSASID